MFENIKINPAEEKTKFFDAIDAQPMSSIYTLGNLYLLTSSSASSGDAQAAINQIKQEISQHQICTLEDALMQLSPAEMLILDKTNRDSISAIKKGLLQDKRLFALMSNQAIIQFGQDLELTQLALIALIRKHLVDLEGADPFDAFDYQLLNMVGVEQVNDLLTSNLVKCSLPIDEIFLLGQANPDVAQNIMLSLNFHDKKPDIEAKFAVRHPPLQQPIADNWQSTVQTVPLTEEAEANLRGTSDVLSQEEGISEFSLVNEEERPSRYPENPASGRRISVAEKLAIKLGTSAAGVGGFVVSGLLEKTIDSLLVPAVDTALLWPPYLYIPAFFFVSVGAGLGGGALFAQASKIPLSVYERVVLARDSTQDQNRPGLR